MGTTRLSVNINSESAAAFTELAERRNTTVTEIVRRAISVLKFLEDKRRDGYRIILDNGTERITVELV